MAHKWIVMTALLITRSTIFASEQRDEITRYPWELSIEEQMQPMWAQNPYTNRSLENDLYNQTDENLAFETDRNVNAGVVPNDLQFPKDIGNDEHNQNNENSITVTSTDQNDLALENQFDIGDYDTSENQSKYIGVRCDEQNHRWTAERRSKESSKLFRKGYYQTQEKAAQGSDDLAMTLMDIEEEKYELNFPPDDEELDEFCSICYEKTEINSKDTLTTDCNHRFHKHCMDTWEQQGRKDCPMCRKCWKNKKKEGSPLRILGEKDSSSWYQSGLPIGIEYESGRWSAQRWSRNQQRLIYNGFYKDEETAAYASDVLARKLMRIIGEQNYLLNFPGGSSENSNSKYIGVHYNEVDGKWYARRWYARRWYTTWTKNWSHYGSYNDEETAAHASDTLARFSNEYYSPDVVYQLNFPDDDTEVHPQLKGTGDRLFHGVYVIPISSSPYARNTSRIWYGSRWSSQYQKRIYNGSYSSEKLAAQASDTLARRLMNNGEKHHELNFSHENTEVTNGSYPAPPAREEEERNFPIFVQIKEEEYDEYLRSQRRRYRSKRTWANSRPYSGWIGVSKAHGKWRAQRWSKHRKKVISNGSYDDEAAAAKASDTLARKLIANGEQNHRLNWSYDDIELCSENFYKTHGVRILDFGELEYNTEDNTDVFWTASCEEYYRDFLDFSTQDIPRERNDLNFPSDNTAGYPEEESKRLEELLEQQRILLNDLESNMNTDGGLLIQIEEEIQALENGKPPRTTHTNSIDSQIKITEPSIEKNTSIVNKNQKCDDDQMKYKTRPHKKCENCGNSNFTEGEMCDKCNGRKRKRSGNNENKN